MINNCSNQNSHIDIYDNGNKNYQKFVNEMSKIRRKKLNVQDNNGKITQISTQKNKNNQNQ